MSSKTLIVDDGDPDISYSGVWKAIGPLTENSHEYSGTLHRGDANGQSIFYSFTGTAITVHGSLDSPSPTRKGLPGVEFQVDTLPAQQINSTGLIKNNLNSLTSHQPIYQSPNLIEGTHNITITITDSTADGPYLYFDFFTVETEKDSVSGQVIVDSRDETIQYVPQWQRFGGADEYLSTASQSAGTGSFVTLNFNGTEVYVYGTTNSQGEGACKIGFEVDGVSGQEYNAEADTRFLYHNLFFSKTDLSDSNHTLKITALNDRKWALDYIVYTTANSSNSGGGGGGRGGIDDGKKSKINTGVIAGGVVGGVLILSALFFLAFWLVRRRRTPRGKKAYKITPVSISTNRGGHARGDGDESITTPQDIPITPFMVQSEPRYTIISPSQNAPQNALLSPPNFTTNTSGGPERNSYVEESSIASSYSGVPQTAIRTPLTSISEAPRIHTLLNSSLSPISTGNRSGGEISEKRRMQERNRVQSAYSVHSTTYSSQNLLQYPPPNANRHSQYGPVPPVPPIPPISLVSIEVDSGQRFMPAESPPVAAPPVYTES